jgi:hypothetical protein
MPIKVTCPKCQGVLHAPDDAGGKRGKCPTCGTVLAIPAAGLQAPPPPPFVPSTPSSVPVGGGRPLSEAQGYGLLPPSSAPAAEPVRQSSVPMLPPPGKVVGKPAAGFGTPPAAKSQPAPVPGDDEAAYRRAKRGLGFVQFGQFLMLLAGLAGPGVAVAKHYGVDLPDKDPGFLGQAGLSQATEIEYGAVLVPLALGLFLFAIGRLGFGRVPAGSFARGPARLAGLFTLLAVGGGVAAAVISANQFLSGTKAIAWTDGGVPQLNLLPADDITGKIQLGGLLALAAFGLMAEALFVGAIGRLAAGLQHERAAARHTRFLFVTHLGLGLLVVWAGLKALAPDEYKTLWASAVGTADDLLAKAGPSRPVVILGMMAVPSLVVWWLYSRLTGAGRRAIRDRLAD